MRFDKCSLQQFHQYYLHFCRLELISLQCPYISIIISNILNIRRNMLDNYCDATHSIHFVQSEDSYSEESSDLELESQCQFMVKCYSCTGVLFKNCDKCKCKGLIANTHPLAELLNQVLQKKLGLNQVKTTAGQSKQEVEAIRQEEQDNEDKRLICTFCYEQCEESQYFCQKCPNFCVCRNCESKTAHHPHPVTSSIRTSAHKPLQLQNSTKLCSNCQQKLENCFSVCKTCQKQGMVYQICDRCTDSNFYIHPLLHVIETMMDNKPSGNNLIEVQSEESEEDRSQTEIYHNFPSFGVDPATLLEKKNSSIANSLESSEEMPSFYNCSLDQHMRKEVSRVKFDIDGLFSSKDCDNETKNQFKQISIPSFFMQEHLQERKTQKGSLSSRRNLIQNNNEEMWKDYLFEDYKCDICEVGPIKNVRYHCLNCEDYDVCSNCYEHEAHQHQHNNFQKIDGRELRQKALKKFMKQKDPDFKILQPDIKTVSALLSHKQKKAHSIHVNFDSFN